MRSLFAVILGAGCLLSANAQAQEFKPFTPVKNVCPTCKMDWLDHITFKDGKEVDALVVAENPAFYVLERNHELRPVGRQFVTNIRKSDSAKREIGYGDQILFKDGIVFIGHIVREREDTGMFEIKRPDSPVSMFGYRSVIASVYKEGKLYWSATPAK